MYIHSIIYTHTQCITYTVGKEGEEASWRSRRTEGKSLSSMLESKGNIHTRDPEAAAGMLYFRNRLAAEETAEILPSFGEQEFGWEGERREGLMSQITTNLSQHGNVMPGQ